MRPHAALALLSLVSATPASALDPIPFVRTPDAQFENLPGYAFEPNYMTLDGNLRIHYVDAGPADGPPILLLHGEPSWSYLYRKMIPPLTAAGYRVIAPDLIGFGRSDKPTNRSDYTYTRHVNWIAELLVALDLQQTTLFCQDWGGLIGLRVVALYPERFSGVIAGNTALSGGPPVTIGPPSHPKPPGPSFAEWLEYSQTVPVFDTGIIIQGGTASTLPAAVVEAYRAPFPDEDETYLAGAREFPTLVGTDLAASQAAWTVLQSWTNPFLTTFSDGDQITWGGELRFIEHVPGAANEPHVIVQNAEHFLQEDKGEELAALMLDFLARNGPGPVAVRSTRFKIIDDDTPPIVPKKRKLSFRSSKSKNGPSGVVEPAFGSDGDPSVAGSSGGGATLTLYKVGGSPDDVRTYALPAALWSQTGNVALPGYTYKDSKATEGPIKKVRLAKGRLTISGKGDGIYELIDAPQEEMALRLRLGTGIELCAAALAREPASKHDSTRKFDGEKDTPPPAACPPFPQ